MFLSRSDWNLIILWLIFWDFLKIEASFWNFKNGFGVTHGISAPESSPSLSSPTFWQNPWGTSPMIPHTAEVIHLFYATLHLLGWLVNMYLCVTTPLAPLSLYRLPSSYSLASSAQNSPLPSTRRHWLERSCGDRAWTRLTLDLIWTLELSQAALEGNWSDWKEPFLGCCGGTAASCSVAVYLSFPKQSFTHSSTFPMFVALMIRLIIRCSCLLDKRLLLIMWWSNWITQVSVQGLTVLIYSSRQAMQVYIQLLKSILPWSASSTASPMLNCSTDEQHNAIS